MKNNGLKIGILSVVVLAAGYALGAFVGWPNSQDKLLSGNVGKADRYKKEVASPELKAFEEKLKSDEQFRSQTVFSMAFINSRTGEFKENALMAAEASSKVPDLSTMADEMKNLSEFATNAEKASGDALEAINNIMKGEQSVDYEELSNNAVISFMLLDKGLSIAQEYVAMVDGYLADKKVEDNRYLAFTRDQWASYSTMDAVLNKNKEMLAYWEGKDYILSPESTKTLVASLPEARQLRVISADALNNILALNNGSRLGSNMKGLGMWNLLASERLGDGLDYMNASEVLRQNIILSNADKLGYFMNADKLGVGIQERLGIFLNVDKLNVILNKQELMQSASMMNSDMLGVGNSNKL